MDYKLSITKIEDTYELKSFIVENGVLFTECQSKDFKQVEEKAKIIINYWIDRGCTFEYLGFFKLMNYKQKLIEWNSTEKYQKELHFLYRILPCDIEAGGYWTLDYGCGIGTAMKYFDCDGYDVNNYFTGGYYESTKYHLNVLPNKLYEHIYFLHSFSHIPNPSDVLRILRGKYPEATLTVITPNAEWLDEGYIGDETVVKHYTQKELKELFESCGYKVTLLGQFGEYKNGQNERIFLQAICDF